MLRTLMQGNFYELAYGIVQYPVHNMNKPLHFQPGPFY